MLYIDKSRTKPLWMMEYSRDEALRKVLGRAYAAVHKDSPLYNRNNLRHRSVPHWFDYWGERQKRAIEHRRGSINIMFSDSNN